MRNTIRRAYIAAALVVAFTVIHRAYAQGGHGPVFGLATPTLPQGAWNADLTMMSAARNGRGVMLRETLRYGLTPDVQVNVSIPQRIERAGAPLRTRIGTMMGGMGDVEASVFWRPHVQYPGVGKRFESTLIVGALYPIAGRSGDLDAGPGLHAAVVTGYASRSVYAWAGGGYQHRTPRGGDRPGDLRYVSAVFGWRPPIFRGDYPKPDWRIFVEGLAEFVGPDRRNGETLDPTESEVVMVGPSVLGLYGKWGIGSGALFPVYQNRRDGNPAEDARLTANISYWF